MQQNIIFVILLCFILLTSGCTVLESGSLNEQEIGVDDSNGKAMLNELVSGSYEAEYPRLSSEEIAALMPRINEAIANASKKYGIDENMIRAILKQESSFQPFALSTSGAMGLMQLMPETAKWLSVSDPYNIEQNIMGGTLYFKEQLDAFGDVELALAAYNAGPNKVRRYNGIPPVLQTQNFVRNVMRYYQLYNEAQKSPASSK